MNEPVEIDQDDPDARERRVKKEVKPWHEFLFEDKRLSWGIFFLLLNFVLFIFLVMWQGISYIDSTEERARFGDMFGAVNTLFSGLAFAGIIYTILL
ncbi:hypothetical protein [Gimesia fumaroli]|uniref:Uncharacterized protein n=1 Tax=Gimesia fumaroli TaxID=2527976 RepID=A0A518I8K6_9PLAN|nr:hypothetical protein [Gimesia fumaroli]QDV49438.1 hypothetical protein Enr17x_14560 [Gimesia fumaroli]